MYICYTVYINTYTSSPSYKMGNPTRAGYRGVARRGLRELPRLREARGGGLGPRSSSNGTPSGSIPKDAMCSNGSPSSSTLRASAPLSNGATESEGGEPPEPASCETRTRERSVRSPEGRILSTARALMASLLRAFDWAHNIQQSHTIRWSHTILSYVSLICLLFSIT